MSKLAHPSAKTHAISEAEPGLLRNLRAMAKKSSAGQTRPAHHNQKIGPYRLRGLLGRGGMADVYLAEGDDNKEVALKVLKPEHVEDERYVQRFEREMEILEHLDSPFAVGLLGADLEDQKPWIATEYVDGPNLREHLREHGSLSVDEIRSLGLCLLDGLEELHASGVFHRDLTPQNVLLSAGGPRIVDFGISHLRDASTITTYKNQFHTPGYIAPELSRGGVVTSAADIYSFGVLLLRAALSDEPNFETDERDRADLGLDFDQAPQALKEILSDCLSEDPEARPSIGTIRERLYTVGESSRPATRAAAYGWLVVPDKITPTPLRRNPRHVWSAAGVVLIAAAAALAVWWPSPSTEVVEVTSTPFETLGVSEEIYAISLGGDVDGRGCAVESFHLVNGSPGAAINGLLWTTGSPSITSNDFEEAVLPAGSSGTFELQNCPSELSERVGDAESGGPEQSIRPSVLIASFEDERVVRVCTAAECEIPVIRHHPSLHFDDITLYLRRNPGLRDSHIQCMSDSLQLSSPAATFDNAESRAAVAVLSFKQASVAEALGYFNEERQRSDGFQRYAADVEDRLDWRMTSFDPASFELCIQDLSAVDTLARSTEGLRCDGTDHEDNLQGTSAQACREALATWPAQSPLFGTAFGCTSLNGAANSSFLGHSCWLPEAHHTPILPGAISPTTGEVSELASECNEGVLETAGTACDFLWLLTGGDTDGQFRQAGTSCGGMASFRPLLCSEVSREPFLWVQPSGEFSLIAEAWARRYWVGFGIVPLAGQWPDSSCGLNSPVLIPDSYSFHSAGVDRRGNFSAEWRRNLTGVRDETFETVTDVFRFTLVPRLFALDEAKEAFEVDFDESTFDVDLAFEVDNGQGAWFFAPSIVALSASPFASCTFVMDLDIQSQVVQPGELMAQLLAASESLRYTPTNFLDPSLEAFELAERACIQPDLLMKSVVDGQEPDSDSWPVLGELEVLDSLNFAIELAEEAASLEPVWQDLEKGLAFLAFAYREAAATGDYEVPQVVSNEIDGLLSRACGIVGWEWSSADNFIFFVGLDEQRPPLSIPPAIWGGL